MPEIAIPTPFIASGNCSNRPAQSLRSLLKVATAADHARLDARLGALDLCAVEGYRRFLQINAAALLPLERALEDAGIGDAFRDWADRARTDAIMSDLTALGGTPRRLDAPRLHGSFAILGVMYVLEGSRLGAAYLRERIRHSSHQLILENMAFLGHGAGRPFWRSFLTVLESHADRLVDDDDIVEPARQAFELFATAAARA